MIDYDLVADKWKKMGCKVPTREMIKTDEQIEGIRKASIANTLVLDEVAKHIRVGMTTQEIDDIVYRKTKELGGIPAPLNYEGFPKSVCTSINDAVCHGIPSKDDVLKDGDIVSLDAGNVFNW